MLMFASLFLSGFFLVFAGGAALPAAVAVLLGACLLAASLIDLPLIIAVCVLFAFNLGLGVGLIAHVQASKRS